jgi:hypothetical protein
MWDQQLDELRAAGKLPEIAPEIKDKIAKGQALDAKEKNDPGVLAQHQMFQTAHDNRCYNMWETHSKYYTPNQQIPGADAPVSMGRQAVTNPPTDDFTYDEIATKTLGQIVRGE